MTNGLAYHYHLDMSTFMLRDIRGGFEFSLRKQNSPSSAASQQGLYCLPMSDKKGRQAYMS